MDSNSYCETDVLVQNDIRIKSRIYSKAMLILPISHKKYRKKIKRKLLFMDGVEDKLIMRDVSDILYKLSVIGAKVCISKDSLSVTILDFTRIFSICNDLHELKIKLELIYLGSRYGFEVLQEGETPLTNRYILLGSAFVTLFNGIKFKYNSIDTYVITETFFLNSHSYFDYRDKIILDIGAAFGDTPLFYAYMGARKVIAVEPVNTSFLKENLLLNPGLSQRIEVVKAAAGVSGYISLQKNSNNYFDGNAGSPGHSSTTVRVEGKTISDIIRYSGLTHVDILKADCKGCEQFFTEDDFELVLDGIEIECDFGYKSLLKFINNQHFETEIIHYDPADFRPFWMGGLIIAKRQRAQNLRDR